MNIFELWGQVGLKGMDQVKQQMSGLEKHTQQIQKGLRIAGAAFTAVGAAGLVMVQSTKKINAQLGVTALSLGVTTKEMRDLTLETTNVTFPIKEVTASFDLLARAGIKDQKVLKDTATAFDTLGDATGYSASQVTQVMVPAMKTFRLSAGEIADKTDMMTYMIRNSTVSLEDFNTMVGYTDQDMVAAGFTIDDMAAAMIYLSDEGVAPGRVMLREWNKAVTKSKEENISMTAALGMTNEQLEAYKGKLAGATGLTQEFADEANKQYTIIDKLRQKWSELTLKVSAFLEPLEPILVAMTAMGPIMMVLSTSVGTATLKWALHTAALVAHKIAAYASAAANWVLHASLGPVGWALVALSVAAAALIPLIQKLTGETKGASAGMDDYTKSLFQNELASALTADEWVKAYEKGYLLEEQITRIAKKLGVSTAALLDNMQAADMLEVVMTSSTDTGRVYIRQLQDQASELDNVRQKVQELTSEQEALTRSWEDFLKRIKPSTKAFGEYGLTSEDVVRYLAETRGGIDAVIESLKEQGIAVNDIQYHLDELGISAKDVADFVGKKKRAIIEETKADREAASAVSDLSSELDKLGGVSFPSGIGELPTLPPPHIYPGAPGEGYVPLEGLAGPPSLAIQIAELIVREDADVERIAEELYRLQQETVRSTGG